MFVSQDTRRTISAAVTTRPPSRSRPENDLPPRYLLPPNPHEHEPDPTVHQGGGAEAGGDSEFRVINTNPRFNKNPFARDSEHLAGEGAIDINKLFPEGKPTLLLQVDDN